MHQTEEYDVELDVSHMSELDQKRFEALESMAAHNYHMAERFHKENEKNRLQVIVWRLASSIGWGLAAGLWLADKFL